MNHRISLLGALALLATVHWASADLLRNNFWINPDFERGLNLDQPDGVLTNWNRGGGDPTICQVITTNSVSPTHALAVVDTNAEGNGYGEWYSDVPLSGSASPGDTLNMQWYEMYNLDVPEMRVTVFFLDGTDSQVGGVSHFVTSGTSSPGWVSTIEDSTFTKRNETVVVPPGAVKMRCSLVSGGPASTTGIMLIDDLSVARSPEPNLLSGNFWVNPAFELGENLDQTSGTVSNWNRGGGDVAINQVITNNYASASHALALVDTNTTASGYGEWYSDVELGGEVSAGDVLNMQWYELYSISGPEMRLTVLFFNAEGAEVGGATHFVTSGTNSPGWVNTAEESTFTRRNSSLIVPNGAVRMRVALVSGGSPEVTGVMVIDDLSVALSPRADLLPGNFWVNSTFELGNSLDQTNGTPSNWNRGGGDTSIDQVITNKFTSPTHALALIDGNTNDNGYGEWYSDVSLSGNAAPGDTLNVQWFELYSLSGPEMRLSFLFFDAAEAQVGETIHFVTGGTNSPGWVSTIEDSSFTKRTATLAVPGGAVRMRAALVSGGSPTVAGIMVIDDLSVSVVPPTVMSGNFFPNPTFELGLQMDDPLFGAPSGGWQRGGSSSSIDQVLTTNAVSPTHSLALVDNDPANYGEWYLFQNVEGLLAEGDVLDVQWFQIYDTAEGNMRLSFAFLDAENATLANRDFNVSGQSPGWTGSPTNSSFERQLQRLVVPAGTTQMRVNFASGGSTSVTGTMLIDDLSVRVSQLMITSIMVDDTGVNLIWNSLPTKTYTVLFAEDLSDNPTWTPLQTGIAADSVDGLTATYLDSAAHSGNHGYYRIQQE